MREMFNSTEGVKAITPQVVTSGGGAVDSGDIDRQGAEGLLFDFAIGANGGDTLNGTNHFEISVEHAEDDGTGSADTYAAIGADDVALDATLAAVQAPDASGIIIDVDDAAEDDALYRFAYIGDRRFVKVTVTPQGTLTNGNPMSLTACKHDLSFRG